MKKTFVSLLIGVLLTASLSGCGKKSSAPDTDFIQVESDGEEQKGKASKGLFKIGDVEIPYDNSKYSVEKSDDGVYDFREKDTGIASASISCVKVDDSLKFEDWWAIQDWIQENYPDQALYGDEDDNYYLLSMYKLQEDDGSQGVIATVALPKKESGKEYMYVTNFLDGLNYSTDEDLRESVQSSIATGEDTDTVYEHVQEAVTKSIVDYIEAHPELDISGNSN